MFRILWTFFSSQPSSSKKPLLAKKWHSIRAKATAKSTSLNFDGRASGPRREMVSPSHWLHAAAASAWMRRSGEIRRLW